MRRRPWSTAVVTGLAAVALSATGTAAARADTARPAPVDPAPRVSVKAGATAQLPERRRSPGLKALLSEEDEDRAGEAPGLSALCQAGIGRPNPYRNPRPNVDQIVGDTIVPVGSQTGCSAAQNENTIAVNPENPRNLVAGTNDYRVFNTREQRNDGSGWAYTSFDGGATWRNVQLPHLTFQTGGTGPFAQFDSAGDPVVAFGPRNTVYYGNIVFSRGEPVAGGGEAANGIALNVSHDGGLHWSEPVLIHADGVDTAGHLVPANVFNDKVWLAADRRNGRVYVTWTRFLDNPNPPGGYLESPIVVADSSDYGRTFSPFRRIDVTLEDFTGGLTPYSQGSNPQVGNDGTLYVAYEGEECATLACDRFGQGDRDVTVVATSRDHIRTGLLLLTWSDDRSGRYDPETGESLRTDGDNIVAASLDGRHWTRTAAIGTPQDEVFGAAAVTRGIAAVTSYTRHWDPNGVLLDYAYWTSTGLVHGRAPAVRRITTQSSDPRIQFVGVDAEGNEVQGLFIGDYTAAALGTDGRLHPNWTDFRGRPGVTAPNQDAYTQSIRLR
jgi:hypothetical protein